MTLQARLSEKDPRLYSVNRDVAHNFKEVIQEVAKRLENKHWPIMNDMLNTYSVTDEDLGKVCQVLCKFVMTSANDPKAKMAQCLERCGWFDPHPAAKLAVMAILGQVILGMHWSGVREATLGGSGPLLTYQDLADAGAECAKIMSMSGPRRWLFRLRCRLRNAWQVLRGA